MTPATLADSAESVNNQLGEDFGARLALVDVDDIYVDRFQRPLDERWLKAREGKLDRSKLQVVMLSERERRGKPYSAVDGQHRIELVRRETKPGTEERKVIALVFFNMTVETEAQLFADFQRQRRAITAYQRFNAELVAGAERAVAIDKIVREEGFALGDKEGGGKMKAVVALENIYDDDPARLRQVLRLVRDTWGMDMPYAQNERMLRAVWYFLRDTDDVSEERFIERLGAVTPAALVSRAHNLREFKGMSGALPRFLAEAVQDQYRSRRAVRR